MQKEMSSWTQQLLWRQQGKFVEMRLSLEERFFFPGCRITARKEENRGGQVPSFPSDCFKKRKP